MSEGGEQFDWCLLVPRTIHDLKVAIIEALEWIGQPLAPSELVHIMGEEEDENLGLSRVSYHMAKLKELDALVVVRTEPVRGSRKHYYWFAQRQPQ